MRGWRTGLLILALVAGAPLRAQAPEGIPRELARERAARISELRYGLRFTLLPHAPAAAGHEELRFKASGSGALLLDFREGTIAKLTVNGGAELNAKMDNGHVELPANSIHNGENTVTIDFAAPIAAAGKAITRFEDHDDGSEYLYTLFVPMDAEMAFPCFDQPDLKGRFKLELTAPENWTVISNTPVAAQSAGLAGERVTNFAETRPISTYLFAFAAGPFQKVHETAGLPGLYVRASKVRKAESEAEEVQQVTQQGIEYLSKFFAQPFPFPKYDEVLIPGFAYGGMEHAGATFLREESVLFRTAPTHSDHLNRDILLLHELTHQWFGDFTTMRWFDDLWLKEGFAQYMAYQALDALAPKENVWKRFYLSIKPGAYGIDGTKGTTPIYQHIGNLKDAKSAYGAIVYSKAPGVIKQLAFVLGEEQFRDGLRRYLKEHAYANAEWSDLVGAFERVSGRHLQEWAAMWIRHRGMPRVDVSWSCNGQARIERFALAQKDVLDEGGLWPIAMQVLLAYGDGKVERVRADLDRANGELKQLVGKPCPKFVFANDQDYAYGRFLLDETSRRAVVEGQRLASVDEVFARALLWGALWDSVREAEFRPRAYIELALNQLPEEQDEELAQSLIGHLTTGLHRYLSTDARGQIVPRAEKLAAEQMLGAAEQDFRIIWFRALRGLAESESGRARLEELLSGKLAVPGVELRPLDRWTMVTSLLALGDREADAYLTAEQKRDSTGDGLKYAYVAQAARPDQATKKKYFDEYLQPASRPEDWIEQSLGAFNYWNQSELTLPYLKPALEALPQMKRVRKIFFVLGWLNAFLGGQQSEQALAQVREFLQSGALDQDLRLKILEVSDELERTVKIRQKYP